MKSELSGKKNEFSTNVHTMFCVLKRLILRYCLNRYVKVSQAIKRFLETYIKNVDFERFSFPSGIKFSKKVFEGPDF